MDLNAKIAAINRVGPAMAKRLKSLEIETINDLLFYFLYITI
jgi:RecG-like helicase